MNNYYIPGKQIYDINNLYDISYNLTRQGHPIKYINKKQPNIININKLNELLTTHNKNISTSNNIVDNLYTHKKYSYNDILHLLNISTKSSIKGYLLLSHHSIYNPETVNYENICYNIKNELNEEELLLLKQYLDSLLYIYSKKKIYEQLHNSKNIKNILKYLFFLQKLISSQENVLKIRNLL